MSEVISSERLAKTSALLHDLADGSAVIEHRQDVSDVLEVNKLLYNDHDERTPFGAKNAQVRVASIPNVIYWSEEFRHIREEKHPRKLLRKWLNDANNRAFRTRPGRV